MVFSFAFVFFSRWQSFGCLVCVGSWLLWNTQKALPTSGTTSFRQSCHRLLRALVPPGPSIRFTRSGWNPGQPSLWVMIFFTSCWNILNLHSEYIASSGWKSDPAPEISYNASEQAYASSSFKKKLQFLFILLPHTDND